MATPPEILARALARATVSLETPIVSDSQIVIQVEYVARNLQNRAGVRLLMSCLLAKIHKPSIDIRKPYTEIGDADSYSGRTYDERYLTTFITENRLPCNPTSGYLSPALRNIERPLTPDINIVGTPRQLYKIVIQLLNDVHEGKLAADDLLAETIRALLNYRDEREKTMGSLIAALKTVEGAIPLSAEVIVTLIEQHLRTKGASRLPVLVVAAAYRAASEFLKERVLPLQAHNAADEQTGALGDVEITLLDDDDVITSYEMKLKRVTRDDIDRALQKIAASGKRVDNYIFITTDVIEETVKEYAAAVYDKTSGIEMVILDCVSFLRHFLHLFHRLRMQYLNAYQALVLAEPESAVSFPLKQAFLALRQAAESGTGNSVQQNGI